MEIVLIWDPSKSREIVLIWDPSKSRLCTRVLSAVTFFGRWTQKALVRKWESKQGRKGSQCRVLYQTCHCEQLGLSSTDELWETVENSCWTVHPVAHPQRARILERLFAVQCLQHALEQCMLKRYGLSTKSICYRAHFLLYKFLFISIHFKVIM